MKTPREPEQRETGDKASQVGVVARLARSIPTSWDSKNISSQLLTLETCELGKKVKKKRTPTFLKKLVKVKKQLVEIDGTTETFLEDIVLTMTNDRRIQWYEGTTWVPCLVGAPNPPAIRDCYLNTFAGFRPPYAKLSDQNMSDL